MPDCLSVHMPASLYNSLEFRLYKIQHIARQMVHSVPLLCLAVAVSLWWRKKTHLSRVKCPTVTALFSITTSNLMQTHFPEVWEPCPYIDKSFFQSFQFAWGRWIVSVTQFSVKKKMLPVVIQFHTSLSALDFHRSTHTVAIFTHFISRAVLAIIAGTLKCQ